MLFLALKTFQRVKRNSLFDFPDQIKNTPKKNLSSPTPKCYLENPDSLISKIYFTELHYVFAFLK